MKKQTHLITGVYMFDEEAYGAKHPDGTPITIKDKYRAITNKGETISIDMMQWHELRNRQGYQGEKPFVHGIIDDWRLSQPAEIIVSSPR